jgi:hypothetical protein
MGMYDFRDVAAASKSEQVRAWSLEQAIDSLQGEIKIPESIIYRAALIEDFVINGKKDVERPDLDV